MPRTLTKPEIRSYLVALKKKEDVQVYTPYKYFAGLTSKAEVRKRFHEILRRRHMRADDPAAYRPFQTDPRTSSMVMSKYTRAFYNIYGCEVPRSMEEKSRVTGVPLDVLRRVYNKGKAAWRTGHRVGANEEQWGYARVHSFLTLGCTVFASDFRLFEEALERMTPAQRRRWLRLPVRCSKETLESAYYKKRNARGKFMALKRKYG